MTCSIPVHADLIPFLERMEVRFTPSHVSPTHQAMFHIDLEITPSNLISYGIAQRKHGQSIGMKVNMAALATQSCVAVAHYEHDIKATIVD